MVELENKILELIAEKAQLEKEIPEEKVDRIKREKRDRKAALIRIIPVNKKEYKRQFEVDFNEEEAKAYQKAHPKLDDPTSPKISKGVINIPRSPQELDKEKEILSVSIAQDKQRLEEAKKALETATERFDYTNQVKLNNRINNLKASIKLKKKQWKELKGTSFIEEPKEEKSLTPILKKQDKGILLSTPTTNKLNKTTTPKVKFGDSVFDLTSPTNYQIPKPTQSWAKKITDDVDSYSSDI